jgi:hypothetical protein
VASATLELPLSTRDTVATDTPDREAISLMVGLEAVRLCRGLRATSSVNSSDFMTHSLNTVTSAPL